MRYENWDVLIFPANSKTPVQEFKTQCFVTRDRVSPYLHSPALINPASFYQPNGNLGQLPVLTTFIASMPENGPFKVSIHSWEQPQASRFMEGLLQPDDALLFEVRVFVDGLCVSGSIFNQRANWPHVIDLSSYVDKNGNQDNLRFPPFHPEILEQRHWDAGDLHGRIRIVIAEGFARPHRTPPFERVKEIIAFSFQHAPLQILECSNIAWPNASMWAREPRLFKYNSGSGLSDLREPEDAHAHSPTRHMRPTATMSNQVVNPSINNPWKSGNYQGPVPQWPEVPKDSRWAPPENFFVDPFIDPYVLESTARHRGARPSWEDISMPDYIPSSTSSRAISSMTGISYEHSKHPSIATPIDEESYIQFFEALSPPKPLSCATQAAPSSTLPMGSKLSAAAEARSASYAKSGIRASVLKDISHPGTREVSESSVRSNVPPEPITERGGGVNKIHASPSGPVKSRKEGISYENKENEAETPHKESDKVQHTPTKLAVRTSGSAGPIEARRKYSTSSNRDEGVHLLKGEPVLLSPVQNLSAITSPVHEASMDNFLDSRPRLVTSATEVTEID